MRRILSLSLVSLSIAALVIGYCLYNGILWFNNPSPTRFPVRGVDVSHHQGTIDWDRLAQENIHFAYIKATQGYTFKDPRFAENWENAIKVGLHVGAYHFFSAERTAAEQMANFIETVPKTLHSLPPVLDVECQVPPDEAAREIIREKVAQSLSLLEAAYGVRPVIYATDESYEAFIKGGFADYPLWIRSVFTSPSLSDGRKWTFWQYSNRGRLSSHTGREEFIDLNVFNGSQEEFRRFMDAGILR